MLFFFILFLLLFLFLILIFSNCSFNDDEIKFIVIHNDLISSYMSLACDLVTLNHTTKKKFSFFVVVVDKNIQLITFINKIIMKI